MFRIKHGFYTAIAVPSFSPAAHCWASQQWHPSGAQPAVVHERHKADVLTGIGGIESVKSAIVDDAELARVVKRGGHRVGYHLAPKLMLVRLFKSNRHAF
ncbi:MAG TPA: hypothetical protein VGK58_09435 [Lacipirellulaceae bacterium]